NIDYLSQERLKKIITGEEISSRFYPLIYDKKCNKPEIDLRSLEFYKETLKKKVIYKNLSKEEKTFYHIGVRDLFFAANYDRLQTEESKMLKKLIQIIDLESNIEDHIFITPKGYRITPY